MDTHNAIDPSAHIPTLVVVLGRLQHGDAEWLKALPGSLEILSSSQTLQLEKTVASIPRASLLDYRVLASAHLDDAREQYVNAVATWPDVPLRGGQTLKTLLRSGGVSHWWLLEPSQRNPESSPVFSGLCLALTLQAQLQTGSYGAVYLLHGDAALVDVLGDVCRRCSVMWSRVGVQRRGPTTLQLLWQRLRSGVGIAIKKWLAHQVTTAKPAPGAVAFHTWFPSLWIGSGASARDRVFADVPEELAGRSVPVRFACTFGGVNPTRASLAAARSRIDALPPQRRGQMVWVESCSTWWSLLRRFLDVSAWRRISEALRSEPSLTDHLRLPSGVNLAPLLVAELRYALAVQLPVMLVTADQMMAFVRAYRPSALVLILETYCYGRAVMTGARHADPSLPLIAVQHSPANASQMFYRFQPHEIVGTDAVPLPDLFLLHSKIVQRQLVQAGVPKLACRMVGLPRFSSLAAHRERRIADQPMLRAQLGLPASGRVVLVVLSIFADENVRLLECAFAAAQLTASQLLVKPHPIAPSIDDALRSVSSSTPAVVWRATQDQLQSLFAAVDLAVIGNSSSDVEAIAIGCPVVRLTLTAFDLSPTADFPGVVPHVSRSEDLAGVMRTSLPASARAMVDAALGPHDDGVTRRIVDAIVSLRRPY